MNTRFKKTAVTVPQSIVEANTLLGTLSKLESDLASLIGIRQKEVDAVLAKYSCQISAAEAARDDAFSRLFIFAQPRRQTLIQKVKTLFWSNGKIGWRWTPPKVECSEEVEKDLVSHFLKNGDGRYLRTTITLDKAALLKHKPALDGVTYHQTEEFFAKPKFLVGDKTVQKTVTKQVE